MTPDGKTKEKYKPLNYLLICLIALSLIAEIYTGFLLFEGNPAQAIVLSFIVLLIYIALIYFVSKFKGFIYRILTWPVIISLINDLTRIPELEIWNMIGIILILAFGALLIIFRFHDILKPGIADWMMTDNLPIVNNAKCPESTGC